MTGSITSMQGGFPVRRATSSRGMSLAMVCVSMSKILTAASRSPSLQRESCRPILQFHPTAKRWQPSAQTVKCIPIRSRAESLAPYRAPVSGSGQLVGARMAASCIYISYGKKLVPVTALSNNSLPVDDKSGTLGPWAWKMGHSLSSESSERLVSGSSTLRK